MENPRTELSDVICTIMGSNDLSAINANIEKYFKEDAHIHFPIFHQPHTPRGRLYLQGIYKIMKLITTNKALELHSEMFSEDSLHVALECTQSGHFGWSFSKLPFTCRYIVRVDLFRSRQGKYLIRRLNYELTSEPNSSRFSLPMGISSIVNGISHTLDSAMGLLAEFLSKRGLMNVEG